jgi:hypothetical protein
MFANCTPVHDATYCPAEKWLVLFKEVDQNVQKSSYTFINIGFNKGYNFATWLNVFAPSTNIDAPKWHEALQTIPNLTLSCGACNDCKVPPFQISPPLSGKDPSIHMVGVDLNKLNIDVVNATLAFLKRSRQIPDDLLSVDLIHAAAGNDNDGAATILKIPRCESGHEMCKIPTNATDANTSVPYDDVPLLGIDKLVRSLHLARRKQLSGGRKLHEHAVSSAVGSSASLGPAVIDVLHIDTEGNDAEVLKSARAVLRRRRVRALIFEYHRFSPWDRSLLADVLAQIIRHDMECFFMGRNRLWPISGNCWHPYYEFHNWSNVMCVLRTDIWYQAIQPLIVTADRLRGRVQEGDLVAAERQVYVVLEGKLRGFNSMDALTTRGYNVSRVRKVQKCEITYLLPRGPVLY